LAEIVQSAISSAGVVRSWDDRATGLLRPTFYGRPSERRTWN